MLPDREWRVAGDEVGTDAVRGPGRAWLVVLGVSLAQGVVGYVQYVTDLPEAPDVVVFSIRKPLLPEQVRLAVKRGGDLHRVTELPDDVEGGLRLDEDTLGLDTALTRLAAVDERLAHVVELRYFAGLSETEIAVLLKRSERSIRRDWQKARMFLLASLKDS